MSIAQTRLAVLVVAAAVAAAVLAGISGAAAKATAPSNTVLPRLDGTAAQGQTVSTSSGSWSGTTPITFTYQWQRCDSSGNNCASISGATSSLLTLGADDVGHTVRAVVTARNSGGTSSATSKASDVVKAGNAPAITSNPSISGSTTVGATLTVSNGSWTGSTPITYSYAWNRCDTSGASCVVIPNATSSTFTLTTADDGHTLRARVTATNSAGTSSVLTNATAVVAAPAPAAPAVTVAPTLSGTATEGQTLTVSTGTWSGSTPISFAYQWARCDTTGNNCTVIPGVATQTYLLTAADVGHRVKVAVTATNKVGSNHAFVATGVVASNSNLPPGAVKLADGEISVPAADIPDTDRLTIIGIKYAPASFHGRGPITATVKVIDNNKYVISGALVYVLPAPRNFANHPAEVPTGQNGTATVQLTLTNAAPHRGALLLFVRARTPQGNLLAGSSTRRLVQVRIFPG